MKTTLQHHQKQRGEPRPTRAQISGEIDSDPNPPDVAIVVVNYNSASLVEKNFGIPELSGGRIAIVVVDNNSNAPERERIASAAQHHGWHLLPLDRNRGFGGGVNAGVEVALQSGAQVILLVNPDARVDGPLIDALRAQCEADHDVLVAPRIVDSFGRTYFAGAVVRLSDGATRGVRSAADTWRKDPSHPAPETLPWITGACMAFSRDLWEKTGGMDERYFLYWEDVDFSYRAYLAGATLMVRHDLVCVHDEGGTQHRRRDAKSATYYYYNCRNRLLFGSLHLSRSELLAWVVRTPRSSWAILMRGGRRQLLYAPRGIFAAFAGAVIGVGLALRSMLSHGQRVLSGGAQR